MRSHEDADVFPVRRSMMLVVGASSFSLFGSTWVSLMQPLTHKRLWFVWQSLGKWVWHCPQRGHPQSWSWNGAGSSHWAQHRCSNKANLVQTQRSWDKSWDLAVSGQHRACILLLKAQITFIGVQQVLSVIVIFLLNLRHTEGSNYGMGPLGKRSTSGKATGSFWNTWDCWNSSLISLCRWLNPTHNTTVSNQTVGNKNEHKTLHTADGKNETFSQCKCSK